MKINLTLTIIFTIFILSIFTILTSRAEAKLCEKRECHFELAPAWLNYPDLTPTKLEVYGDATGNSERDILVCLTVKNNGVFPITSSDQFDIYRNYSTTTSDFYQDTVYGPLSGIHFGNNEIQLEYRPRLPGTGTTYTGPDPIAITYIVDYDDDIAESRENNNEITISFSQSKAEYRESCDFE